MGWETTRILRIYPKEKFGRFDIVKFCENIARTASGLSSHVLWFKNVAENCYDLKFNSSKSTGDLKYDPKLADIWELKSADQGTTGIGCHHLPQWQEGEYFFDIAQFKFDHINIKGSPDGIGQLLETIGYPTSEYDPTQEHFILDLPGHYEASNYYNTIPITHHPKSRVAKINQAEFLGLSGDTCFIEKIETHTENPIDLHDFLVFVNEDNYENYFKGLDTVEFQYNDRIVKRIQWISGKDEIRGGWIHSSADWWDNCMNKNWLGYYRAKSNFDFTRTDIEI